MTTAASSVPVLRSRLGSAQETTDTVAVERPLEVRLDGRPYAVLMRTPGADRQLVAGFLLSERVITSTDDLGAIEECQDDRETGGPLASDTMSIVLTPEAAARAARLLDGRRDVMATAACGVCGRATLASMQDGLTPLPLTNRVPLSVVRSLPARLRDHQRLFNETGGSHAAGAFDASGAVIAMAEDVGRHNAVDKVTGTLLLREILPASDLMLCVSGRTAYEIVQKAWCAGITFVVSVSAPTSLAIALADDAGITLAGFVRDDGVNIYTHASRIEQD